MGKLLRSSRVELAFTPVYETRSRLQLGVAESEAHQCFGTYASTVVGHGGDTITVDGLFGWAGKRAGAGRPRLVVGDGIDPSTSRFSGARSTN